MKAVIQCAGTKDTQAGYMQTKEGERVMFVADPSIAPNAIKSVKYVHPDDDAGNGETWRQRLVAYNNTCNEQQQDNPFGLLPAYRLYSNDRYGELVEKFGSDNVYIMSAGWGLINADFLTPNYDITYSQSARGPDAYKRRKPKDFLRGFLLFTRERNRLHSIFWR